VTARSERSPGLGAVLARPAYRRLWVARTVSQGGDVAQFTTAALLVLQLTGSGIGLSGLVLAEIAPVLLLHRSPAHRGPFLPGQGDDHL
jgi:hypothetical protein